MLPMDRLHLNEREIAYYFNLFNIYDTAKRGQIPFDVASTLLSQSGLSQHSLSQILNLCGATRIGYFGRNEFFLALKLVALAQAGSALSLDSLEIFGRKLPLPSFENLPSHLSITRRDQLAPAVSSEVTDTKTGRNETCPSNQCTQSLTNDGLPLDKPYFPLESDSAAHVPHDDWIKFDADDTGLLTNERVERLSRYTCATKDTHQKADSCEQLPSIPHFSSTEGHKRLVSSSDSSASEDSSFIHSDDLTIPQSSLQLNPPTCFRSTRVDDFRNINSNFSTPSVCDNSSLTNKHTGPAPTHDEQVNGRLLAEDVSDFTTLTDVPEVLSNHDVVADEAYSDSFSHLANDLSFEFDKLAEYTNHFNSICANRQTEDEVQLATYSDVRRVFATLFSLTPEDFDLIWQTADLDHDNSLNKIEFCIASHLAYLFSVKGIPISKAAPATCSFMQNILSQSMQSSPWGAATHQTRRSPSGMHCFNFSNYKQLHPLESVVPHNSDNEPLSEPDERIEAALLPDVVVPPALSKEFAEYRTVPSCSGSSSALLSSTHSSESSSVSLLSSSESDSSLSDTSSNSSHEHPTRSSSISASGRKARRRKMNSVKLLVALTGRSPSKVKRYSSGHRRRLLLSLIHEAKTVNHVILRLNNEMHGEWTELKDQRVNLSVQLEHLGLHPPS